MLGFPIAGVIGIGWYQLTSKRQWMVPVVYIVGAITQFYIQQLYSEWLPILFILMIVLFIAILGLMIMMLLINRNHQHIKCLLLVLLILPGIWSCTPIIYGNNQQIPIAGPELVNHRDSFDNRSDYSKLIDYLEMNREGADYLVAAPSAMSMGSELILQSGEPVMILQGFNGGDNPVTTDEFKEQIEEGLVKYALVSMEDNSKNSSNNAITEWIKKNGINVDEELERDNIRLQNMSLYRLQ
jgi:4-amino-4-deoxy-L-arabinose transferase-like glycosyltransferase